MVHKILEKKRKKYQFLSLFFRQKALVVDFIPLDEIPEIYLSEKIDIDRDEESFSYLPREIGEKSIKIKNTLSELSVYGIKNLVVPGNSSFFLTLNRDRIYYEKIHEDERKIYLYNDKNIQFHSYSLAKIKNLPIKVYKDKVIFFGGTFTTNYYHFLVDILSKTQFISRIPNYKNLKIALDISAKEIENFKILTDSFLRGFEIIYLDNTHYHQFDHLWFITSPNPTVPNIIWGAKYEAAFSKISPSSISYLRKVCLKNFDETKVQNKSVSKIFIARKSDFRKYNEPELIEIAKKYEFTPVYFEDLNIHEQIEMFQNAEFIIGSSGAAWTNLIFAKEKSKGLMWLGTVWGDFSVFSTIANLVNFDLNTLRFTSKTDDFHEDYILDPAIFEDQLQNLLKAN